MTLRGTVDSMAKARLVEHCRIIGEIDTNQNPNCPVMWNPGGKVEFDGGTILLLEKFVHLGRGSGRARKLMMEPGDLHPDRTSSWTIIGTRDCALLVRKGYPCGWNHRSLLNPIARAATELTKKSRSVSTTLPKLCNTPIGGSPLVRLPSHSRRRTSG